MIIFLDPILTKLSSRSRGSASGIVAALCYVMVFISTKTYLDLEHALGMPGIVFLYGAVGVVGFLFFYFLLPETENRTLEDIETHFSTQSITNIKIKRVSELVDAKNKANGSDVEVAKKVGGVDNVAFVEST